MSETGHSLHFGSVSMFELAQHVQRDGRDGAGDSPRQHDVPRPEQGNKDQQDVGMKDGPARICSTIHGSSPLQLVVQEVHHLLLHRTWVVLTPELGPARVTRQMM